MMSSSWRVGADPPADFLHALYGEQGEENVKQSNFEDEEDVIEHEDNDDKLIAPPYFHLTSPERRESVCDDYHPELSRSRSRSPIRVDHGFDPVTSPAFLEPEIVIKIDNEKGTLVLEKDNLDPTFSINEETLWSPDAHALYGSSERMNVDYDQGDIDAGAGNEDGEEKKSVRGRVRGRQRERVYGLGRARQLRGSGRSRRDGYRAGWVVGQPLEEIWVNDDDVPSELRDLVEDVVGRREIKIKEMRERLLSKYQENYSENVEEECGSEDEEFQNATDGRCTPHLEGDALLFKWSPMVSFRGDEELFRLQRTGCVQSFSTPYDTFRSYWDDSILQYIVDETNQYATKNSSAAFQSDWYPTNSHEILCLFAFWMMLGIIRMPTIASCFSKEPVLKTEIFRRIFSHRRYFNLSKALHFVDVNAANVVKPTDSEIGASSDRLYSLRSIINHLNAKFQENYVPSKDIFVSESMILWNGNLHVKQYIQAKATKFGIITYELCESTTSYVWSFIVDTGILTSTEVVKKLIHPLLNKGYRLFMDNRYSSPRLARFLKRNGTDCVGTLRSSCIDVPPLVNQAPLKQGQVLARHSGDVCVLSWQNTKRVTMISTCHGSASAWFTVPSKALSRPLPFKPQVVLDYNKWMGGVDLKDQLLEPYLIERKRCHKWHMKLFKRLLNCSILNARILLQSSMQCPQDHLAFRLHLVDAILNNHLPHLPHSRSAPYVSHRSLHPARMTDHTHWPVRLPQTASDLAKKHNSRKGCTVCIREGRKFQKTYYKCEACDVPLCVDRCFKIYHTT